MAAQQWNCSSPPDIQKPMIGYGQNRSVRLRILSDKILAQLLRGREPELKIGIGSAGHGWMRDRHGLGPEAPPIPEGRGRARLGLPNLWSRVEALPDCAGHFRKWTDSAKGAILLPMRIHMQPCSAELAGRRYLAVKPILFMS